MNFHQYQENQPLRARNLAYQASQLDQTQPIFIYTPPSHERPITVRYPVLAYEDPIKIAEILAVENGKVVTIAASGTSSIIALASGVNEVDAVDISTEQIAYNYALQHLFLSLSAFNFREEINTFNAENGTYGNRLPFIRQRVLRDLPQFFEELNVPEKYHEAIAQFILFERFSFVDELDIKDQSFSGWIDPDSIENIRNAILENRWRLHEVDLINYLKDTPPEYYDSIYTSNVFDHLQQTMIPGSIQVASEEKQTHIQNEFSEIASRSLKPGGKMNLHNLHRPLDSGTAWKECKLQSSEWSQWHIDQSEYLLKDWQNGTWYRLTKK
ncbi:hypothetical protein A2296_02840 [candidate division CPR3 bacterium RIFOXYB2_FULL_35_8]|nr:MAG: hypothetical protein A2296_02840 [candidate division CPR3 bacterium RIFOXYB2_FULL_35_8]